MLVVTTVLNTSKNSLIVRFELLKTEKLLLIFCKLSLLEQVSINDINIIVMLQKKNMKYLLLLFTITFQGQTLHHQMLSAQGTSTKTSSGLLVSQTVGQQSITGTSSSNDFVVMQGFQQSLWAKYIASNKIDVVEGISTITYPNPFTDYINFQFSKAIADEISISIFDILGRLVYQETKKIDNNILTIDLARLPTSQFLVRLNTNDLNYYTKITKQ